jgi:hypothetical protein
MGAVEKDSKRAKADIAVRAHALVIICASIDVDTQWYLIDNDVCTCKLIV